jgi:hypothetical protein
MANLEASPQPRHPPRYFLSRLGLAVAATFQIIVLWIIATALMNVLNRCATEFDLDLPPGCTSGPIKSVNELALIFFIPTWVLGTAATGAIWCWWKRRGISIGSVRPVSSG